MAFSKFPDKDPDAILDYYYIWSEWLGTETLSSHTISATGGITVVESEIVSSQVTLDGTDYDANTVVRVRLSGGTAGRSYEVTCHIVASNTEEDDRTRVVRVKQR